MFEDIEVTYILLPVIGSLLAVMLLLHLARNKQATPLETAFRKFKFASISYGVLMVILLLCLPATGIYRHIAPEKIKSLEEAVEYQRDFGADLNRIRDILHYAFFLTIFWFWGIFNFVKVLAAESIKKSD